MSSSSSVCQGLQSCVEPRTIESRILRLKLSPPGSNLSSPPSSEQEEPFIINNEHDDKNDTKSSWSFLQTLKETNKTEKTDDKIYVHPIVKRSSSMLSEKSLEMCTESLGSETGSNAGESSDDVSFFTLDTRNDANNFNNMNNFVSRRVNKASNFPPPLTSIIDFGGVHVRPHREGGRLILEAIASPSISPYFHAERCDGRLKLSLFETIYDYDGDGEDYEGEEVEESEKEYDEVCEEEECVEMVEEDEMGVTKFRRPRRCKESGNRDFFGDGYFEIPSISLCL